MSNRVVRTLEFSYVSICKCRVPLLGCHSLAPRCFGGSFFWSFPLASVDLTLFEFVLLFCLFLLCSFGPFVWIIVFQHLVPLSLLGILLFFSSRLALQHGKCVLHYVSNRGTSLSLNDFHCLRPVFRRQSRGMLFVPIFSFFLKSFSSCKPHTRKAKRVSGNFLRRVFARS